MTKMNRAVRAALVTVAALSGGLVTLASAQTAPTMPMTNAKGGSTLKGNTRYTPTKAQCMTPKYKSSTACKAMMMKGRVQVQRSGK